MKPRRAPDHILSGWLLRLVGAALSLSLLACLTPQRPRVSGQPVAGRAESAPVALALAPARHPEELSCDEGDAEACMRVGLEAIAQAQPEAHVAGVMALYRACELSHARGCLVYALALWSEHGVAYDAAQARWALEGAGERAALLLGREGEGPRHR